MARNTTKAAASAATNVEVGSTCVVIGCKLPHGLILDHPLDPSKKVEINGLYAKILTPGQIDKALEGAVWSMKGFYPDATNKSVKAFISDDDGAFAAFLKEKAHDA